MSTLRQKWKQWNPLSNNNNNNNNCCNHNNNRGNYGTATAMKQKYASKQEQTALLQQFLDSLDDTYDCVEGAAALYLDEATSDKMVDTLCDGAVVALNMFAGLCEDLYQNKNQDAIDLGTKRAMDKFAALKSENKEVYKLIEPHRKFMIAALKGNKNLRYTETRVDPAKVRLFEQNVDEINHAFAKIIANDQQFEDKQRSYRDPELNKKLEKDHRSNLNKYRSNDNYKDQTKNDTNFVRPKQSDLYYTKKGRASQFKDRKAEEQKNQAQDEMDVELWGAEESAYDKLRKKSDYSNAVLMLSGDNAIKYNSNKLIKKPVPCKILSADKKHTESRVVIRMCIPYNRCTFSVPVEWINMNTNQVIKMEAKYIKKYGKLDECDYLSIEEQSGGYGYEENHHNEVIMQGQ